MRCFLRCARRSRSTRWPPSSNHSCRCMSRAARRCRCSTACCAPRSSPPVRRSAAQHAALRISLSARRPSCKPSSILHHHPSLVMAAIAILSPSLMMGTTANERTGCIHNRRASHAAARTHAHDAVRLELRATSRRTLRAPNRAAVGGHHLSQLVVVRGAPATNTTTRSPRIELAFLFPPPPR